MKNLLRVFVSIAFCCLCRWQAAADYLNPPDWSDSNDFTHQTWDFLTDQSNNLPALPDGEPNWSNPFGQPGLTGVHYSTVMQYWLWNPQVYLQTPTDRRGFYGGMGDTTLTFHIPNLERQGFWQKQVWLQVVYWARKDGGQTYELTIARDSSFADANDITPAYLDPNEPNEDEGSVGKFYRLTAAYRFEDQPAQEYVRFTAFQYPPDANRPIGGASMVDQISIDTRCINLDLVEDEIINLFDYAAFAAEYLGESPAVDLHPDGSIDKKDLAVLLEYWLEQD